MQLSFLGNTYNRQPHTIEIAETETTARFLGNTYSLRRPIHTSPTSALSHRKYRGVAY